MVDKKKELQDKIDEFKNDLDEKFKDKKFLKKFNSYKNKIEEMVDCNINIEVLGGSKFEKELNELGINSETDFSDDEEYWNSRFSIIKELNEYYIDAQEREIYYSYDIDQGTPFYLETKIKTIERLNPFYEEDKDNRYIKLNLCSYGGDAYGMLGCIDVIRLSKTKIKGIANGQVMSAGAYILIGCHYRVMTKNSVMMLHDLNTFLSGNYKDIGSDYNHIQILQNMIYEHLEKNSNKNKTWWENKLQRNYYLTSKEAKELELIDEII